MPSLRKPNLAMFFRLGWKFYRLTSPPWLNQTFFSFSFLYLVFCVLINPQTLGLVSQKKISLNFPLSLYLPLFLVFLIFIILLYIYNSLSHFMHSFCTQNFFFLSLNFLFHFSCRLFYFLFLLHLHFRLINFCIIWNFTFG